METPQNGIRHGSFLEVDPTCPNLSLFPLFLPSSFQQEAFGCECFFMFVLFLGWLGGCGGYFFIRGVPDISHTPRIISSLVETPQSGIQHGSFLEVAPTCPTFHFSIYFFHLLFSEKHLVVIVFFMFCPVSVLVGWLQQLLFYSKGSRHLIYP